MANGRLQLEIVTPSARVLTQAVDEVRAPGFTGGFGVRPGHTPFLAQMNAGELIATVDGREAVFAVGEGFVQVADDRVLVLAETADRAEEINLDAARSEVSEGTARLRSLSPGTEEYEVQRARVERAAARVFVAGKR